MIFDIGKLIRMVSEYLDEDKKALFGIVKDYDPYNGDGGYDYDVGLEYMNDNGICTYDGEELKGRIEAFETVLEFIGRITEGGDR